MKKKFSLLLLSCVLVTIGLASSATPVVAEGEHDPVFKVALSIVPRFPVVGQEAKLTFKISSMDGVALARQDVMVMLNKNETGGHGHGEANAEEPAPAGGHDMANMGGKEEPVPTIHLMPNEVSPGVYVDNVTFEQGGRYVATVIAMGEEVDVVVPVRAAPIAWWFVGGLAGLSVLMAAMVAVVKTVRRTW